MAILGGIKILHIYEFTLKEEEHVQLKIKTNTAPRIFESQRVFGARFFIFKGLNVLGVLHSNRKKVSVNK